MWGFTYSDYTAFRDAWTNSSNSCSGLLGNEYIRKMLDYNYFALLHRCFSFDVLELEDQCNAIFKEHWKLHQILCVDETQVITIIYHY
jgi:hypothetical protein